MIYRKSVDVHAQEHADEFSISLNLMIIPNETVTGRANQLIFDSEKDTIKSTLSSSSGRIMVCDLAQYIGDSETAELLDYLAVRHPDSRTRGACIRSLVKMLPDDAERVYRRVAHDSHAYVKHLGESGLELGDFAEHFYAQAVVDPHAALDSGPGGAGLREVWSRYGHDILAYSEDLLCRAPREKTGSRRSGSLATGGSDCTIGIPHGSTWHGRGRRQPFHPPVRRRHGVVRV